MRDHAHKRPVWPRRLLVLLSALNAVGALGGALGLVLGILDLGPTVTGRLPFGSAVLGGVALGLLVAVPNGALLVLALQRSRHTGPLGIAVGAAMVVWILVQLAFIRELSFFHPLYVAVGLLMVWAGNRTVRLDVGASASSVTRELLRGGQR
jgi:hypothetical protein